MATLRTTNESEPLTLPAQALVGRSQSCFFRVTDTFASQEHAKIAWTGNTWTIRDLGSRNGTFVDGVRLEPGVPRRLGAGSRIGLGQEVGSVEVLDVEPPVALAIDLGGGPTRRAIGEVLLLPDDERPEASVFPDAEGNGWRFEDADGNATSVEDQEVVSVDGRAYRLDLPMASEATPLVDAKMSLQNVTLRFGVTRDEEQAEVTIILRGIETTLDRREYAYFLLTLARCRREDEAQPPAERGWRTVDELRKMMRMERNALNVAVHRARQRLAAAGLEGAAGIVETRTGSRRLGTDRFEIVTLDD